jgi:hypothetical protein
MKDLSRDEALSVISKWERQNQSFWLLCMSPGFFLESQLARTVLCLDHSLQVSLCDDATLRILTSEADFSRVEPGDFQPGSLHDISHFGDGIPKFEDGICIEMANCRTHWYLLAAEPSSPDDTVSARK